MPGLKIDHDPLLAPGMHALKADELFIRFVQPFENGQRRWLFNQLKLLLEKLTTLGIPCELWINGSFVTSKEIPSDIDISIKVDGDVYDNLCTECIDFLEELNDDVEPCIDGLDTFVFSVRPMGHENYEVTKQDAAEWAEQWIVENAGYWLKGIASIKVLETGLGLRLNTG